MVYKFWRWYRKNLHLNQTIVAILFGWQILHLYWLTTHVVADRMLGYSLFDPTQIWEYLLIIADYFEIPALISATLLYSHFSKERNYFKNILFIILINSQWIHIFWITDEFVISHFRGEHPYFPIWLIWSAILIDYLELPIIYDTIKKTTVNLFKRD